MATVPTITATAVLGTEETATIAAVAAAVTVPTITATIT